MLKSSEPSAICKKTIFKFDAISAKKEIEIDPDRLLNLALAFLYLTDTIFLY